MPDDYEVRGIFNVGYYDYDATSSSPRWKTRRILRLDDTVHGLIVMLNDPYQADEVRNELLQTLGTKFQHHDLDGRKFDDARAR